ncbi:hypothetical protein D3C72_1905690 [compost metagenome]
MTDGSGTEVDARDLAHIGVIAQRAAQPGVAVKQFAVDKAVVGQHREQPHGRMPLAHQEPVAVGPLRLAGTQAHHVVVQRGKDLRAREHRAVMPDLGNLYQTDCLQPDVAGLFPQHRDFPFGGALLVLAHRASFFR